MSPIVSGASSGGSGIGAVLFDSTLGGDAASIDTGANGIAQTQNVLEVWVLARTDEAVTVSTVAISVNNDAGANYDRVNVSNANATVSGNNTLAAANWLFNCAGASIAAGVFSTIRLSIPSYISAAISKTGEAVGGEMAQAAADTRVFATQIGYRPTTAISRMKVANGGGTVLKAGSRLLILGR